VLFVILIRLMVKLKLSDFQRSSVFYETIEVVATIKRSRSHKYREGVYWIKIKEGKIIDQTILFPLLESRGLFFDNNQYCYSNYDTVFICGNNPKSIQSVRFGYIHNLQLRNEELLICSTQNDTLFIYDVNTGKNIWSWSAFADGYSQLVKLSGDIILRNTEEYDKLSKRNKRCYLLTEEIRSNDKYRKGLFINSAYFNDRYVLFSSLNTGYVYEIDRRSKKLKRYPQKYISPHGVNYVDDKHFLITSTEENKIYYSRNDIDYEIQIDNTIQFQKYGITKWLQTSRVFDDFIIAIDSITNEIIVIDFDKLIYDKISFAKEWRMHDIFLLNPNFVNLIKKNYER